MTSTERLNDVFETIASAVASGVANGSDVASWYRGASAAYPAIAVSLAHRIEDRAEESTVWFDAFEILCA